MSGDLVANIRGPQGPQGPKGDAGTGVTIEGTVPTAGDLPTGLGPGDAGKGWIAQDTGHLWVWDGDSWTDAGNIQGPPGAQGPQGPAGAQGPKGDTGATGAAGTPGTPGATGSQGPKGDTGAQGTPGTPGATGSQGPKGDTGATGSQGPQGNPGATGNTGAAGTPGSRWYSGTGAPSGAIGAVGDWYLNDANGDVYEKTAAAAWTLRDNLTGPQGIQGIQGATGTTGSAGAAGAAGSRWYSGAGAPAGGTGAVGDWYLDTTASDYYEKTAASTWALRGNLKGAPGATGSPGIAGSKWYSGSGAPAAGLGVVGDWYLNTANGDVHEKTAVSTWLLRDNLTGPTGTAGAQGPAGASGSIWWVGTTSGLPPANTVGNNGDWFLDDATGSLFGPKAAGAWPATPGANTLKGPPGPGLPEVYVGGTAPTPRANYTIWVDTSQASPVPITPTYTQSLPAISAGQNIIVDTTLTAIPTGKTVQINIGGTIRCPAGQYAGLQILDGSTVVWEGSISMPSPAAVIPLVITIVRNFTAVPIFRVAAGNGASALTIDAGARVTAVAI